MDPRCWRARPATRRPPEPRRSRSRENQGSHAFTLYRKPAINRVNPKAAARPTTAPRRQPQPLNDHHAPQAARSRSQREPDTDFLRPQRVPGTPRAKFDGDCTKKQCPRDWVPGRLGSRTASLHPQSARPVCGVSNSLRATERVVLFSPKEGGA